MKRLAVFCLIPALILSLAGCITLQDDKAWLVPENIASVDVYDLGALAPEARTTGFHRDLLPVYTLTPEQQDGFLSELSSIEFTDTILIFAASDPGFTFGQWVIRLNFTDGGFRLISCAGHSEAYNADGSLVDTNHYGCDDDLWNTLIQTYLPSSQ